MRNITYAFALIIAVVVLHGCGGNCKEAASSIGVFSQDIDTMARDFLSKKRNWPNGPCFPNSLSSQQQCLTLPEASIAATLGIVCPVAPTIHKDLNSHEEAPDVGQSVEAHLKAVPFLSLTGVASASAKVKSYCAVATTHVHSGAGTTGTDPEKYLNREALAEVDFELTANTTLQMTFSHPGVAAKTAEIDAGEKCTSQFAFRGCGYARDGGACNAMTEITPWIDPGSGSGEGSGSGVRIERPPGVHPGSGSGIEMEHPGSAGSGVRNVEHPGSAAHPVEHRGSGHIEPRPSPTPP
jgi:hypothetical protein